MTRDLHEGFREPRSADPGQLSAFLREADRLPGVRQLHRGMRRVLAVEPGTRILDAGCGIGLEAMRLAVAHPRSHVTGLDRNGELLRIARSAAPQPANVTWLEMDLTELELASASFDVIRTERVLMYLPGTRRRRSRPTRERGARRLAPATPRRAPDPAAAVGPRHGRCDCHADVLRRQRAH